MTAGARQIRAYLEKTAEVLTDVDPESVAAVAYELLETWDRDGTVLVIGNGGSATTAAHIALDLTKQTLLPGRRPLRALALGEVGLLTAWANDSDFSRAYAEQLLVHARPGDVLMCISCSGNSPSIIEAIVEAHGLGMTVIGLGGFDGGQMREMADIYVHVPSHDYGLVESVHLGLEHCLTAVIHELADARPGHVGSKPVVLLDRDGVINRNLDQGVRRWEDFEFLPGALQGLSLLAAGGHSVVVISNQANVGRGRMTPAQLADINRRMTEQVMAHGGEIDAVYVCEHAPQADCDCRKPAPGLILQAASELGFALPQAYLIGDHETDVKAARAAGVRPVLVLSGRHDAKGGGDAGAELVASDLLEAAELIVSRHQAQAQVLPPGSFDAA
jgi:histidinol-phosphate phosphatase family protein